jgi:hypothetical protein
LSRHRGLIAGTIGEIAVEWLSPRPAKGEVVRCAQRAGGTIEPTQAITAIAELFDDDLWRVPSRTA